VCGVDGHEVRVRHRKLRSVLGQSHQDSPAVCVRRLLLRNVDIVVAPKHVPSTNACRCTRRACRAAGIHFCECAFAPRVHSDISNIKPVHLPYLLLVLKADFFTKRPNH
jgi:hypothetical protein